MTTTQPKPYQLVLWGDGKRPSDDPAVRQRFDTQEDAMAALKAHELSGRYRTGMLMQWDKQSGGWKLIAQFF